MGGGNLVQPDLEPWAAKLLAGDAVGHLGLLDDRDHPRVLPVTFAIHGRAAAAAGPRAHAVVARGRLGV